MRFAWVVGLLGVGALATAAGTARADRPSRCSFAGEPAPTAAQLGALEALDVDIDGLRAVAGDHRPIVERLRRILEQPCFRGLENVAALPELGSPRALEEWWRDGGRSWLESAIAEETLPPSVVLPPSARRTLALDGNEKHQLAPLLCRAGEAECGRETGGWMKRGTEAARGRTAYAGPTTPESAGAACNKIRKPTLPARYAAWRDCVEGQRQRYFSYEQLPLGRFRAPASGWLVVRGRRGHYTFTDELAAYDLATGAVYRAIRRGDLGILPPTDAEAAERRRTGRAKVTVDRGRVPLENLREAALMMMLWPERRQYLESFEARLPPGLRVTALPGQVLPSELRSISGTSADTWLAWDWIQAGKAIVSGTALHRGGSVSDDTYPTSLLEIAEAGLQPGCPAAALPPQILARGSAFGGVEPIDASRAQLDAAETDLATALTEASKAPCDPKRGR